MNIEHCLKSVREWVSEIIIIDSFSADQTLQLCKKYTDKIYQHSFENQARQFNWGLDNVPIHNPWILRLDADEMITPELAQEIRMKLPNLPQEITGVYMKRRVYFMGRWIKHGGYYPKWFLRIFQKGKGHYEELTEEHFVLTEGRTIQLKNDFVDYNRKGLTFWVDKHNHWSIGEMLDTMAGTGEAKLAPHTIHPSFSGTQEQRMRWLKNKIYVRFPLFFRAFLYFLYRYLVGLGFLDGPEGLIFHFMQGFWYRFLVDAKIYEARKFGFELSCAKREYTGTKPWERS